MRTHGWSGAAPASDDEAIARILDGGEQGDRRPRCRLLHRRRRPHARRHPPDGLPVLPQHRRSARGGRRARRRRLPGPLGNTPAGHHRPRRSRRRGDRDGARVAAEGQAPRPAHRSRAAEPAHRVGDAATSRSTSPTRWCAGSTSTGQASASATPISTSSPSTCCGSSSRSSPTRAVRRAPARNCATTCGAGSAPLYDRQRQRLPRLEHPRRRRR